MVKVNIEALPKKKYAKTINNPCLKVGINTTLFLLTTLVLKIYIVIFYLDKNKKINIPINMIKNTVIASCFSN